MKLSSFLLSLTILAAAGQALPANAQEGGGEGKALEGGMRWDYKPNVWGAAKKQKPKPVAFVPTSVTPGAMPHSSVYTGLDPSMFKKAAPPPPPVQQQVQAIVSVPRVQAAPFNNQFGGPVVEHIAQSKPMTESPSPAAKSMSPQENASSGNVSGRLRHPGHLIAQHAPANSLPQIQSYGGQGYTPGVYDAGSGGSGGTSTALSGRVILPKRH